MALFQSLNCYSGCRCAARLWMRSCGMMGSVIFWDMNIAFRAKRILGYSSAKTAREDVAFVVRPALCWLTSIHPYIELRYVTFDNPGYVKVNANFVYHRNGQGNFSTKIPSRTLDSVFNLDTGDQSALARLQGRRLSWCLICLVSTRSTLTIVSAQEMRRLIEEPSYFVTSGFLRRPHGPILCSHLIALTHFMNIPFRGRAICTISITFWSEKRITQMFPTQLYVPTYALGFTSLPICPLVSL